MQPSEEERRTQIALFRYGLIAALLNRPLGTGRDRRPLPGHRHPNSPDSLSTRTHVDEETAWRYLQAYRRGGFEALKPKPRSDGGQSRRIPPEILAKAIALREEVPSRSAATIIQILRRDPAFPADLTIAPAPCAVCSTRRARPARS